MLPKVKAELERMFMCWPDKTQQGSVKRERFILPTIDEILPRLAESHVFFLLNAASGFCQMPLKKEKIQTNHLHHTHGKVLLQTASVWNLRGTGDFPEWNVIAVQGPGRCSSVHGQYPSPWQGRGETPESTTDLGEGRLEAQRQTIVLNVSKQTNYPEYFIDNNLQINN